LRPFLGFLVGFAGLKHTPVIDNQQRRKSNLEPITVENSFPAPMYREQSQLILFPKQL